MRKPYELHEVVYRRMRRQGTRSWDETTARKGQRKPPEIDPNEKRFLLDVLAQPWAPRRGRVIELGCGTAPMLRWLGRRGFSGVGADVSGTAIQMARAQSRGLGLRFRHADLCRPLPLKDRTFDLALDGHCLHCITDRRDRKAFLGNVRRLLRPGGVFIVLTMCGPVDRGEMARVFAGQHLVGRMIYLPCKDASRYEGARTVRGRLCIPTRYIADWRTILRDLREARFDPVLFRYHAPRRGEPTSSLAVAGAAC